MRKLAMAAWGLAATVTLTVGAVCLTSGCASIGYLAQSTGGHLSLIHAAKPVAEWTADPATPEPLRARLELSQRMRDFAVTELELPDNGSYRRYADLGRRAAVWNVVAAPELSLTLRTSCFPVVGCVGYRGYYDEADAKAFGDVLKSQGLEVNVYPVPAYSTLGKLEWLGGDPLLNTFVNYHEADLARLMFHELAHQVAYAANDTTFNESFATAVERIGGARWLERHATPAVREQVARTDAMRADFRALVKQHRDELDALYKSSASDDDKRRGKAQIMARMRAAHQEAKAQRWGGSTAYDGWFERANNAVLGVMGAYHDLVPDFERLFEREGRDFDRFYAEVRRLAALPKDERREALSHPRSAFGTSPSGGRRLRPGKPVARRIARRRLGCHGSS
jgi:predicted aminopeptidase